MPRHPSSRTRPLISPPPDPWISSIYSTSHAMSYESKFLCRDYPALEAQLKQQSKMARQLKGRAERIRGRAGRLGFCTLCRAREDAPREGDWCQGNHWTGAGEKGRLEVEVQSRLAGYVWWMEVGCREEVARNVAYRITTEDGVTRADYDRSLEEQVNCVDRLQEKERGLLKELEDLLGRVGI